MSFFSIGTVEDLKFESEATKSVDVLKIKIGSFERPDARPVFIKFPNT